VQVSLIILNILLGIIKIINFIYLANLLTFNITSCRPFVDKTISYYSDYFNIQFYVNVD